MQISRKESTPVKRSSLGMRSDSQMRRPPPDIYGVPIEIIPSNLIILYLTLSLDKLFWVSDSKPPQNYSSAYFFCIDNVKLSNLKDIHNINKLL